MEYSDLIRVWNNRFIIREIIHQDSPRWDDMEEKLGNDWICDIHELDTFENVFGFEHNIFYDVVNVDTMESEIIIEGGKYLGDKWSMYYDSEDEIDMSTIDEPVWVRIGIDRNGNEYVTYCDTPEVLE